MQNDGAKGLAVGLGAAAGIAAWNLAGQAIGKVTDFLGDATRAAIDEEASNTALRQSLNANVPAWDGNRDAIEKVIASRMRLGFSDDEQRNSLARLLPVYGDVTEALDVQRVAMDLAAFKHVDLESATLALIRTEGGQYRALKELIGSTKDINSAEEALAAVHRVTAGAAEELANKEGGKLKAAQIALDEIMEKFGAVTLPLVTGGMQVIVGIAETVGAAFKFVGDVIGAVTGPISDFVDGINDAANAHSAEADAVAAYNIAINKLQNDFANGVITEEEYRQKSADLAAAFDDLVQRTQGFTVDLFDVERASHIASEGLERVDVAAVGAGAGFSEAERQGSILVALFPTLSAGLGVLATQFGNVEAAASSAFGQISGDDRGTGAGNGRPRPSQNFDDVMDKIVKGHKKATTAAKDQSKAVRDELADAYDKLKRDAHDAMEQIHDDKLRAIDDAHDVRDAELDAQQDAIRAGVSVEEQKVRAMRDARRERELRAAVTGALTPEDRAAATQALADFLDDQRLMRLDSDADAKIAAIDIEKEKNDLIAAAARERENKRYKDAQKALDDELRLVKSHIDKMTKDYDRGFREIAASAKKWGVDKLLGINPTANPTASAPTSNGRSAADAGAGSLVANIYLGDKLIAQHLATLNYQEGALRSSGGVSTGMTR